MNIYFFIIYIFLVCSGISSANFVLLNEYEHVPSIIKINNFLYIVIFFLLEQHTEHSHIKYEVLCC